MFKKSCNHDWHTVKRSREYGWKLNPYTGKRVAPVWRAAGAGYQLTVFDLLPNMEEAQDRICIHCHALDLGITEAEKAWGLESKKIRKRKRLENRAKEIYEKWRRKDGKQ